MFTERVREPPREARQLAFGQRMRIALHAALSAAERDVHQRALERHDHRERFALVETRVGMKTQPAFVRAENVVVLDAVALEEPVATVIHQHREVDDDLVLRLRKDRAHVLRQLDDPRGPIELVLNHVQEIRRFIGGRHRA
jgi:hypothetical protein